MYHQLSKFYSLEFDEQPLPGTSDVRRKKADRLLDAVLAGLDAEGTLPYAQFIPLARRLAETDEGKRQIAKLIAHYVGSGPVVTHDITLPSPNAPLPDDIVQRTPEEEIEAIPVIGFDEPAAPEPAEEPTPRKTRRKRQEASDSKAETKDTTKAESAETVDEPAAPAAPAAAPVGDLAQRTADWLRDNPGRRRRGRFRSIASIAEGVGAEEDTVTTVLQANPELFEKSRSRDGQWRARVEDDSSASESKSERRKGERTSKRSEPAEATPKKSAARKAKTDDKPSKPTKPSKPSKPARKRSKKSYDFDELRVNLVDGDFKSAEALAERLAELAGLDREDLGAVRYLKNYSYVEVRSDYCSDFVAALNGEKVGRKTLKVSRPRRRKES